MIDPAKIAAIALLAAVVVSWVWVTVVAVRYGIALIDRIRLARRERTAR